MQAETTRRKLAVILSADVVGYSRLMENDDEATVHTIKAYRQVLTDIIEACNGRVVDSQGDNLLAEFTSAINAVKCATTIQETLKSKNDELAAHRRMYFRIGINLGDVIEEDGNLYGSGVNIAARLESLTEPGGVSISGTVYDQLEGLAGFQFEAQGEHRVKNIAKPVRVYSINFNGATFSSATHNIQCISDKPSIAVLPFVNMSGDEEEEYFSDGITEDLITDLSKISGLFVIARNSVFVYKGKTVKIDEVGRELGVRYVLEGSIRKSGNRVRITTQLIDVATQGHIWAERFDRELGDIFELQDEVNRKIISALSIEIREDEQRRLARKGTDNLIAYDYILRGSVHLSLYTKESYTQAKKLFEKALAADPNYALAHSLISLTYLIEWLFGWRSTPDTLNMARALAEKAVSLDDALAGAHLILGLVYLWEKQHEIAIEELEIALSLDPNNADGYAALGSALTWAGRFEEAIIAIENALRRNPYHPAMYLFRYGQVYALMGAYEKALKALQEALADDPKLLPLHCFIAFVYMEMGNIEQAQIHIKILLKKNPDYTIDILRETFPLNDQKKLQKIIDALIAAGLT